MLVEQFDKMKLENLIGDFKSTTVQYGTTNVRPSPRDPIRQDDLKNLGRGIKFVWLDVEDFDRREIVGWFDNSTKDGRQTSLRASGHPRRVRNPQRLCTDQYMFVAFFLLLRHILRCL